MDFSIKSTNKQKKISWSIKKSFKSVDQSRNHLCSRWAI